jgi:hypothetical protein
LLKCVFFAGGLIATVTTDRFIIGVIIPLPFVISQIRFSIFVRVPKTTVIVVGSLRPKCRSIEAPAKASLTGSCMGSSITIERTSELTKAMGNASDLVVWWQLIATVIANGVVLGGSV